MSGHVHDELAAYAEDELDAGGRARVERHLASCDACRAGLQEVRRGIALASELERTAMPADLAARIREAVARAGTVPAGSGHARRSWAPWRGAAAAILLVVAGTAIYWQVNRPWVRLDAAASTPTAFERDGRALHDRLAADRSLLRLTSSDEAELWRWLAAQGAPVTAMRVERPAAERERFVPVGAAVQTLGSATASVLEYRIDGRPVTLALAHAEAVAGAPAAGWWTKRVLHRRDAAGVNTLAWTIGGGTYVMMSELDGAGQRACLICHVTPQFRERLDELGTRARAR